MSNELKIEAGKYYQIGSGHRVYVCATNKPGSYPVVAWNDSGYVHEHTATGRFYDKADGDESNYDIISEWVEPERIPWDHLPKWCRWWAKDENGEEWGYRGIPEIYGSRFCGASRFSCPVLPENHSNYSGDWRNSLRERPEGV